MYKAIHICRWAGYPESQPIAVPFVDYFTRVLRGELPDTGNSFSFLLDISVMQFLYITPGIKAVTGYPYGKFMQEGYDFILSNIHPDDRDRLRQIHKAMYRYYFSLPLDERRWHKYSFDYRIIRSDGNERWLLKQVSFVEVDCKGKPSVSYNVCTDITPIKENKMMMLIVTRQTKSGSSMEVAKMFFPPAPKQILTPREAEIVRLMLSGFNSREIGEKLYISEHTVNTHRQNMLKKTGSPNMGALLGNVRTLGLSV